MQVVILAGGYGTRLSEYTDLIPKPMVKIGGEPILKHIMKIYSDYGFKDFYIALGYKGEVIKNYFLNYKSINSDFTVNLKDGTLNFHNGHDDDWRVTLVDTGVNTMTGGRLLNISKYLDDSTFMMTYGDGLSNVNINKLLEFHKRHGKLATITAVQAIPRFGLIELNEDKVTSFSEKPKAKDSWINGGFFVFEKEVINYIRNQETVLEKEPLENLSKDEELHAYKHRDFWQCMDTKRDKDYLEEMAKSNIIPWRNHSK